jgi:hypothetical protein
MSSSESRRKRELDEAVKTIGSNVSGQDHHFGSSTIPAAFNQFCDESKHTVGEPLLQVCEAKWEQAAYESATKVDR